MNWLLQEFQREFAHGIRAKRAPSSTVGGVIEEIERQSAGRSVAEADEYHMLIEQLAEARAKTAPITD